jgi:adenosylmethionine-8-amino-7-oxononanoate aminotransferase
LTELEELDHQVSWHPFTQMAEWSPLVIVAGQGCYLFDQAGNRYLDGVASLWCNVHGHRHPELDTALEDQLERIAHSTYLGLAHEPGIRLAAELLDVAPTGLTRVFFSDSGSTAVEVALKQSFQYWQLIGRPTKRKFLRLGDAYHGDTLGAVGVGGIDLFHRVFGPLLVESMAVPSPAVDSGATLCAIEEAFAKSDEIAAFIVEPLIQGAAGMLVHPDGFLREAARLCREHEVHLIVDEVATGFGRTGTVFACEQEDVSPDFLCVAKGVSAGYLPLAATLTSETIYRAFLGKRSELKHFFHGHTYTANPLACAVARASLRLLQKSTLANSQRMSKPLQAAAKALKTVPGVRDVRFRGLMVGIEVESRLGRMMGAEVSERARAHHVILRPLGDVVVWMPPLVLGAEEVGLLEAATRMAIGACFT